MPLLYEGANYTRRVNRHRLQKAQTYLQNMSAQIECTRSSGYSSAGALACPACKGSAVRSRLPPPKNTRSPSSRGLGHRPFTAVTGVRIPVGTPASNKTDTSVSVFSSKIKIQKFHCNCLQLARTCLECAEIRGFQLGERLHGMQGSAVRSRLPPPRTLGPHLEARTSPFHGGNRVQNPRGDASINKTDTSVSVLFSVPFTFVCQPDLLAAPKQPNQVPMRVSDD